MRPLPRLIAALALAACAASSQAQVHETRQGDHLLRSSTVASNRIDPATAAQHGIEPAASRAVLNVLVLRRGGAADTPVAAAVTASMQNLAGVRRDISLREVNENGRVSYVGSYDFLPREVIDFEITALPDGAPPGSMLKLSYRERMWRY
ncbi:DUF4426 domain-containing protein [Polaromonas sp. CG_9.11]|uniref:DUF4426 domain-containing protein n=1 Tax=Polaromonas sp. CG_9.11 TaxID=2787730 RepID=UPI0018CB83C8|nr:DUF4426 domain-containing protein [Polaromonas sp. CG_9.11]MBG6075798.1 hypothetical protein [Polaromonas sp. CG_9.11]